MATFSQAPHHAGRPNFPGPVGSLGLSLVSLPIRDEGQALVRIRPTTRGLLTTLCHLLRRLRPALCPGPRADHGTTKYPESRCLISTFPAAYYHQVVTEWAAGDYVRIAVIATAIVLVAVSMIRTARDTAPKELRDPNTSGAR